MTYSESGNLTVDDEGGFAFHYDYDSTDRLVRLGAGPHPDSLQSESYTHNAMGQRVVKTDLLGATIHFIYDLSGRLMSEYKVFSPDDETRSEYVWLDGLPLAFIVENSWDLSGPEIHAIHSDHLGTPQVLTNAAATLLSFDANYDPFGGLVTATSVGITFSLGFPGQYVNWETGLHYNYFRTYNPYTGRYLESDPIGIRGGLNTYAYVGGNPVTRVDPRGLTWGSNWNFFWDWWFESGAANRTYGPNDFQTQEMVDSAAANFMRDKYESGNCKDIQIKGYSTLQGAWDTGIRPWEWGSTATQVGGFIWSAVSTGYCQVRYRVYNTASLYSFFYHIPGVPHKQRGGWFPYGGNIEQKFEWTERSPCCRCGGF